MTAQPPTQRADQSTSSRLRSRTPVENQSQKSASSDIESDYSILDINALDVIQCDSEDSNHFKHIESSPPADKSTNSTQNRKNDVVTMNRSLTDNIGQENRLRIFDNDKARRTASFLPRSSSADRLTNRNGPMKATANVLSKYASNDVVNGRRSLAGSRCDLSAQPPRTSEQLNKEKEETFKQLYVDYNTVLKRLSMAENTIDEMRLGAKVNLYSDGPTPGRAEPGTLPGPLHGHTFALGRGRTASLGNVHSESSGVVQPVDVLNRTGTKWLFSQIIFQ